ncbi:SAM-dependent methyltransferase [Pseudonocardia sulfidoxydans NBRC 16205]|uniref:SAM-dependent methyltransferase n=1 Tax=Pseudonocardia sulfidoxydans NBRC 16205 TaxID=1223511 RepID=A0A511DGU1_9PSEU|nr:class I SAM-dependent methyltransferase [Pseudonocardia sulfidoxydans]GEL24006.1 SAM-dependent methyltransferase [Pseudonocardia sulfidoxydans NBRC 16205]
MAVADRDRWDARHAGAGAGAPAPPDALRGREHLLPAGGRALDVACGRGTVAAWLAQQGFDVDAVDVSPVALAAGAALEPRVRWVLADLDTGLPADCAGPYDVVVCQRFRDPRLYPALAAALAPGGLLVLTVLSEVGDEPGPFRAVPGELAFPDLVTLAHEEGNGSATLIASRAPDAAPGSPPAPPAPS